MMQPAGCVFCQVGGFKGKDDLHSESGGLGKGSPCGAMQGSVDGHTSHFRAAGALTLPSVMSVLVWMVSKVPFRWCPGFASQGYIWPRYRSFLLP